MITVPMNLSRSIQIWTVLLQLHPNLASSGAPITFSRQGVALPGQRRTLAVFVSFESFRNPDLSRCGSELARSGALTKTGENWLNLGENWSLEARKLRKPY